MNRFTSPFKEFVIMLKFIHRKYRKPKIEMTPFVKASLFALRLYVFILIGLMVLKFIVTVK